MCSHDGCELDWLKGTKLQEAEISSSETETVDTVDTKLLKQLITRLLTADLSSSSLPAVDVPLTSIL